MVDRPHIVIPGDVTSSFATSQELTGDTLHLAALTRTAHSRLIISTTSPEDSQCRRANIWMQPGPCVVARTAITPDGDKFRTSRRRYLRSRLTPPSSMGLPYCQRPLCTPHSRA